VKQPKNILEVYYEPAFSGITRHVGSFVKRLSKENYKFHVVCATEDEQIERYFQDMGIDIHIAPPDRFFAFLGMVKVIQLIYKFKIDIVHVHNLQSIFWGHLPRLFALRTKFFFTPHVINFENKYLEKAFFIVWKAFALLADKIIVLSPAQKSALVKKGVKREGGIIVIPNSIPSEEIAAAEKGDIMAQSLDTLCILSVLRLVSQKAPLRLIDVAEIVCRQNFDAHFYIVGDGPMMGDMERAIAQKGLRESVRLLGFRKDALNLIAQADILLSTAQWEGLPYTLLEGMALAKPIVASAIDGHEFLVKNGVTGYLSHSTEALAGSILLLLKNESKRREMGRMAHQRYMAEFSFESFIAKMRGLYDI